MGETGHPKSITQVLRQSDLTTTKNKSRQQATFLRSCCVDETLSNGST